MKFARIVFAYLVLCSTAFAQVGQIPSWPPNKPGAGVVTLDPANKGVAIGLSGGNLTASNSNAANTDASVKSTTSHASGKYYAEVTVTAYSRLLVGIGNASATLTGFVGSDANGIGWFGPSNVFVNGVSVATIAPYTAGQVLSIALDIGNGQIWFLTNNTNQWNGSGTANPATNTGGISLSGNGVGAGPYFLMVSPANNATTVTVNFGATAYSNSVPSGFGNW